MMRRFAIPFPPFHHPPFPHAGCEALSDILPSGFHMQGLVNLVPTPLSGTKEANSRHKPFILLARSIPEYKMMTGTIIARFRWFGLIMDVVQSPSDHAVSF